MINDAGGSRAGHVSVYGVDDRFWKFHGRGGQAPEGREILLSPALAREIGAAAGASVVVRMQKPSAIPAEWLHGRKDDARPRHALHRAPDIAAGRAGRIFAARPAGRGAGRFRSPAPAAEGPRSRRQGQHDSACGRKRRAGAEAGVYVGGSRAQDPHPR